ncbi:hypothetical protein ECP02999179_5456 [Escherichia coli P0299917.9]|nr:hypothetical protein ECP02999179_5456 [Escherichia coli P0299917.9]
MCAAWTPGREDVLLSLAGEIEDEDSRSLNVRKPGGAVYRIQRKAGQ